MWESKDILRKRMKTLRDGLSEEARIGLSGQAVHRLKLLPEVTKANTVFCYISIGSELSTLGLLMWLRKQGKNICVPKLIGDKMLPVRFESLEQCAKGRFGIPEPKAENPVSPSQIDICIAPGLAFDRDGQRLGYGKGYYDRFFSCFSGIRIALCFDFQIVERIPAERTDERLSVLVSDRGIYRTEANT